MEAFLPWDSPVPTAWKYLKETKNAWCSLEMMQSICSAVKIVETDGFIVLPQKRRQSRKNWWLPNGAAMSILVINKKCPKCESIELYRIKRSLWMRLIPKSKYYLCELCDGKFISVDDSFSLYWPFGKAAWVALPPLHAAHLPEQNGWFFLLTKPPSLAGYWKTRYFLSEHQVRHSGSRGATIRNPEKAISYWIPDLARRRRTRPVWRFGRFQTFS